MRTQPVPGRGLLSVNPDMRRLPGQTEFLVLASSLVPKSLSTNVTLAGARDPLYGENVGIWELKCWKRLEIKGWIQAIGFTGRKWEQHPQSPQLHAGHATGLYWWHWLEDGAFGVSRAGRDGAGEDEEWGKEAL